MALIFFYIIYRINVPGTVYRTQRPSGSFDYLSVSHLFSQGYKYLRKKLWDGQVPLLCSENG